MTNTAGFDPQHDARFQRGYDPNLSPGRAPGSSPGRAPGSAPGTVRASAPGAVPRDASGMTRGGPPTSGVSFDLPEATNESGDFVRDASRVTASPPERRGPRGNPFVIVLWVLGPLLVAGGGMLIVEGTQIGDYSYVSNEIPFSVILQQISWSVAPAMITVGLATVMGLFFWHAVAWHRIHSGAARRLESPADSCGGAPYGSDLPTLP